MFISCDDNGPKTFHQSLSLESNALLVSVSFLPCIQQMIDNFLVPDNFLLQNIIKLLVIMYNVLKVEVSSRF